MKKIWYYTFVLFALLFAGCDDTDELEADINSLKERVSALESKVEMLNGNIKALNILCQEGMIISKVEHDADNGVYTLTLSDGTKLKLAEKTDSFASVPLVNISDEGYWQVSYDNGRTYAPVLQGNAPMNAVAKDGETPKFQINVAGNWEVSTDGGSNYAEVKDANGNPVKAVYDASSSAVNLFESVTEENGALKITFDGSGKVVEVPVVPDFECYFMNVDGEQKINPGETKTFEVYVKGADKTLVTAPMGWKATLGTPDAQNIAELTVIAPQGKVVTRAEADNTRDIAVLAFKGAFATLAKMQVNPIEVETGAVTPPTPSLNLITIPISGETNIITLLNTDPFKETSQTGDFWFHRSDKSSEEAIANNGSLTLVDETVAGKAVKAVKIECKIANSFFKLALGYFKKEANCDITKKYKLSFKMKGASNTKLLTTVRNANNTYSFAVYNEKGDPTTTVKTSATTKDNEWEPATAVFDFSKKAPKVASIPGTKNDNNLEPSATEDAATIDIRIYPQAANTTFYITDVKFEEYVPVTQ